jgi:hypothetical protein
MRVDNRVNQPPPRNRDNEATSRSADLGRNRTRAELLAQLPLLDFLGSDKTQEHLRTHSTR